ncbi:MAG: hypothetical protein ACXW2X_03155 [Thermoanaerobaculia bacterium]
MESEGKRATVRASLVHSDGRQVFSTVFARDFDVPARGLLLVENVIASITGSQRDALGDLHDLQITFDVVAGEGAATIFLLTTENGSGATTIRQE